jgi:4-hydroxybenzoyl-CoA thioesterase
VFYPNYLRWFDQATHELFRGIGFTVQEMFLTGHGAPVIEARIRYLSSLVYDDEIEILSHVGEIRTRAFRLEHRVVRHGLTMAQGYEVRIWARLPGTGESRVVPDAIPQRLRDLLGTVSGPTLVQE